MKRLACVISILWLPILTAKAPVPNHLKPHQSGNDEKIGYLGKLKIQNGKYSIVLPSNKVLPLAANQVVLPKFRDLADGDNIDVTGTMRRIDGHPTLQLTDITWTPIVGGNLGINPGNFSAEEQEKIEELLKHFPEITSTRIVTKWYLACDYNVATLNQKLQDLPQFKGKSLVGALTFKGRDPKAPPNPAWETLMPAAPPKK